MAMELPSGRSIFYNKVRALKKDIIYTKPNGLPETVWHGLLVENAVQGIARDLIAEMLLRLEAIGLGICHMAHDSVLVEVDEAEAKPKMTEFSAIMNHTPTWAKGLPVKAEAVITKRMI
jgi:DNA polymerase